MKRNDFLDIFLIYNGMIILSFILSYLGMISIFFNKITFEFFLGYLIFMNVIVFIVIGVVEIIGFIDKYEIKIIKKGVDIENE